MSTSNPYMGEVRLFAFGRTPLGWLQCNGQLLQISQYESLYDLLGTTYGGDGISVFGLPNLNGSAVVGQGAGTGLTPRTLGEVGGTDTVTLTSAMVPAHTHAFQATVNDESAGVPGPTVLFGGDSQKVDKHYLYPMPSPAPKYGSLAGAAITTAGGNQPHPNIMPSLGLFYCMAVFGLYPSAN